MIIDFDIKVDKWRPDRDEMFNLRNKDCQVTFNKATDVNPELLNCFKNDLPIEAQGKRWIKTFNSLLHKCFKKVSVVNNKKKENTNLRNLINERTQKKQELKPLKVTEELKIKIKERIKQIEEEMEKEITEEHQAEMIETLRELSGEDDCIQGDKRKRMWKFLKKKYLKITAVIPVGKKDRKGNIITNH